VQSTRPWDPATTAVVDEESRRAAALRQSEIVETATMLRADGGPRRHAAGRTARRRSELSALRHVHARGRRGPTAMPRRRPRRAGAPDLIAQLGLRVGGSVFIGQARFEIRGVISGEPGRRAGAFSLGPRVVIDRADLASTGLIGFGSRASYQRLLQLPDVPLEPSSSACRHRLSNSFASVRSYHDTEAASAPRSRARSTSSAWSAT
jgi:putative ABC transport system permease protein